MKQTAKTNLVSVDKSKEDDRNNKLQDIIVALLNGRSVSCDQFHQRFVALNADAHVLSVSVPVRSGKRQDLLQRQAVQQHDTLFDTLLGFFHVDGEREVGDERLLVGEWRNDG